MGSTRSGLVLTVGAALLLGGCAAATEEPSVEKAAAKSARNGKKGSKAAAAGIGDKVTLKGTTYRVTKASTAKTVGDNEFTKTKANGTFVVVRLSLTNRKSEPATIMEANMPLVGGNGKKYSTSDDAILAMADQSLLLEEIQPDVTEKGVLVYDVPTKALKGARLRVEDLFSDSTAEIDLGL